MLDELLKPEFVSKLENLSADYVELDADIDLLGWILVLTTSGWPLPAPARCGCRLAMPVI